MQQPSSNKVILNEDNIIEVVVSGDQTPATIKDMGAAIGGYVVQLQAESRPILILDDVQAIGQVPPRGRKMVVELGKTIPYVKLALVGKPGILRLGSNLLLRAMGKGDKVQYFDERAKALKWLKA